MQEEAEEVLKSPCRICHCAEETRADPLVAPCRCDGSLKYVHNSCQQAWLRRLRTQRPGLLDWKCELCRTKLACRTTLSVRVQILVTVSTSVGIWYVQAVSVLRSFKLAAELLTSCWHHAGRIGFPPGPSLRGAKVLPPVATVESCAVLCHSAVQRLVLVAGCLLVAQGTLQLLGRSLVLHGEEFLTRLCVVKIGGSVLMLLHQTLWAFPPVQRVAPLPAWEALGATLLLDTLLLSFLRVSKEDRSRPLLLARKLVQTAFRLTGDFLPFAVVFLLWSASVLMMAVASVIPALALLFHNAFQNLRRRRLHHGSLQMAVFVLRLMTRLCAATAATVGSEVLSWPDVLAAVLWLGLEAGILMDFLSTRRPESCVRDTSSQVLWTLAVGLQAAFLVQSRSGYFSTETVSPLRSPRAEVASGPGAMTGTQAIFHWIGQAIKTSGCRSGPGCLAQDAAFALCAAVYLGLHSRVFSSWARRLRQAFPKVVSQVEPDQVIFYTNAHHRRL